MRTGRMTGKHAGLRVSCALLLAAPVGLSTAAFASPIDAGFDAFVSLPGTQVDLSDLGLGIVPLEGELFELPFAPGLFADTIVERKEGIEVERLCHSLSPRDGSCRTARSAKAVSPQYTRLSFLCQRLMRVV